MSSESSDSEEYDWDDWKDMLKDQCEALNDEYLRLKKPREALVELVEELTELFDNQMDHHDLLIDSETDAGTRTALIESAVKELTETLDRLATSIRDNPDICRKLRYGSSDSDN
ncbi:hypothetical protein HA402_001873 [Bradysia odoriphaga]|nr:hypothetical protein HA402_001873 [Bradysia odoriphaga]